MINDRNSPTFCHFSFLQREAESLLAVSFNNIRCCALSIPIGRCTSAVIDEPVHTQRFTRPQIDTTTIAAIRFIMMIMRFPFDHFFYLIIIIT